MYQNGFLRENYTTSLTTSSKFPEYFTFCKQSPTAAAQAALKKRIARNIRWQAFLTNHPKSLFKR
jgi:hypothetical protein